jgi:hypothetical protein
VKTEQKKAEMLALIRASEEAKCDEAMGEVFKQVAGTSCPGAANGA